MNAFVGGPGPSRPAPKYVFEDWRQFLRFSDIRAPANIFVFLDEHPDSINDGWFVYCTTDPNGNGPPEVSEWSDLPASYHDGAGSFAFADGHSEIHKWMDARTGTPVTYSIINGLSVRGSVDVGWIQQRTPP